MFSTVINECSSQPCSNGGLCVDQIDYYLCQCNSETLGTRCQIGITSSINTNSLVVYAYTDAALGILTMLAG